MTSRNFERFFPSFTGASVVIAATNETSCLVHNVEVFTHCCNPEDIAQTIIGVCRKTTDETMALAHELCNKYPEFHFTVCMQKADGIGNMVKEFIPLLTGSHVVFTAADNGTDFSMIPRFIELAKQNPGSIPCGSRWAGENCFEGYGAIRKPLNHLFQIGIRILYQSQETDFTYPYQLASVSWHKAANLQSKSMAVFLENRLKMTRCHFNFIELPAVWKRRPGEKTKIPWKRLLNYSLVVLRIRFTPLSQLISIEQ